MEVRAVSHVVVTPSGEERRSSARCVLISMTRSAEPRGWFRFEIPLPTNAPPSLEIFRPGIDGALDNSIVISYSVIVSKDDETVAVPIWVGSPDALGAPYQARDRKMVTLLSCGRVGHVVTTLSISSCVIRPRDRTEVSLDVYSSSRVSQISLALERHTWLKAKHRRARFVDVVWMHRCQGGRGGRYTATIPMRIDDTQIRLVPDISRVECCRIFHKLVLTIETPSILVRNPTFSIPVTVYSYPPPNTTSPPTTMTAQCFKQLAC